MRLGPGGDGHLRRLLWGTLPSYNRLHADPQREDRHGPPRPPSRDALRVKPGSRVRLATLDPAATFGHDKASAAPLVERAARAAADRSRIASGPRRSTRSSSSSRGSTPPARTAPSSKVMEAFNPQGCVVSVVQGPDAGGARPRLPVADPQAGPGARARSASSTARTTRTSWSSASTTSCRDAVWSTRYDADQRLRGDAGRERDDDRQVLPVDRPRRAAQALPGALRRPDEALEVLAAATSRSGSSGTTTRPPSTTRCRRRRRRRRRGTSSRPTASGSATWRSRRSWPTRWPGSAGLPDPRRTCPPNLVIE